MVYVLKVFDEGKFLYFRAVRPKHRDRGDRSTSTSAIPSTSSAIHNVASSSSSGSSPTPSHSVPEPSSSYHCEDEAGSGYNSGDEYGPARSMPISEEEWEQVIKSYVNGMEF